MYSIKNVVQGELIVKNSKFLGLLFPVTSEDSIVEILKRLRLEYSGASHYCYAYVLGDSGDAQKASDDGEPQKTAGIPILEVLKKNDLTNLLAVVIRYFGGTLLGASGLIRAYSKSISSVVERATLTSKKEFIRCSIKVDYPTHNHLERDLFDHVRIDDTSFMEKVSVTFSVLKENFENIQDRVKEHLAGESSIQILEEYSVYEVD